MSERGWHQRPRRARRCRRSVEWGGGRFGAKARSARATEGLGEGFGVRGGAGGGRGRALGARFKRPRSSRDIAEGEAWGARTSGRAPRSGRDLGEVRIKSSGVWNF